MTLGPIDALTKGRQTADALSMSAGTAASTDAATSSTGVAVDGVKANAGTSDAAPSDASTAAARKVAEQFEAIFLRKLMSGLEKSGSLGGTPSTGSQIYGSMMVGAFADKAAEGGGLGLAALVLKSLLPTVGRGASASSTTAGAAAHAIQPLSHAGTAAAAAAIPLSPGLGIGTAFKGAGE
jgi:flagellar protein FlgJ